MAGSYDVGMASIATRLRLSPQVQDSLLAVFVAWFQVQGTRMVAMDQELARPLAEPANLGYLLLTVSGLVLVVRRRWPVAVFATTVACSVIYYTAGYPDGPGWVGLFVAIYTVAALGDGHRSLQILVAGKALLITVWLLTADLQPFNAAGWVFFRIGTALMVAALGESVPPGASWPPRRRSGRSGPNRPRRRRPVGGWTPSGCGSRGPRHRRRHRRHQCAGRGHRHVLDKRPEQARDTLVVIEQTSARALGELRATLGMLREANDDRRGRPRGLNQVEELAALAREAGLDVKVEVASPTGAARHHRPRGLSHPAGIDH